MSKAPTITQVRRLHDKYAEAVARWGDHNLATVTPGNQFYDALRAWEAANPGKTYDARGRR